MKTPDFKVITAIFAAAGIAVATATAQDAPPSDPPSQNGQPPSENGRGPGGPGGPGGFDAFRQRMNERIKTALKATDEEWSVIQPLLENVQKKQHGVMEARMAGLFGGEHRGGRGRNQEASGNQNNQPRRPQRPTVAEIEALKAALENDKTSTEEIKTKLEAVRAMRKKAETELATACEELRKVLTLRQEAVLVMMGILQ